MKMPLLSPTEPIEGEEAERLLLELQKAPSPTAMAREIELAKRHLAEVTAPKAAPKKKKPDRAR